MAETTTYLSLCSDLKKGRLAPVYILHGEEGYYIDDLVSRFEAVIAEDDRDFDLSMLYAPDFDSPAAIVADARQLPLMSPRRVVIVKEMQTHGANFANALAPYVASPNQAGVLVLCFRGEKYSGAELTKAMKACGGVIFESKKLNGANIDNVLSGFIKEKGLTVDHKALAMLAEFVGTDLSRLYKEVDKLTVVLGPGAMITPEAVERNIGISKDYNHFEFVSAIANRDVARTMRIFETFRRDPKDHAPQMLAPLIFNLFANLMVAFYAPDKSDRGLMGELGFKWPSQLKDVTAAMRHYGPWQTIEILNLIRRFDGASKGNGSRQDAYALFFDLIVHILNPLGQKAVKL